MTAACQGTKSYLHSGRSLKKERTGQSRTHQAGGSTREQKGGTLRPTLLTRKGCRVEDGLAQERT